MGLIQKVRVCLGIVSVVILFSFSAIAEEYHSGHVWEAAPAVDPEVSCQTYLVNVRNDMITQLERERTRLNGIATCLTTVVDESGTCTEQTAGVLDTLGAYRDYEANRFLSTVGYDSYRMDAAVSMRTNADFGVNNLNTATMGGFAPMTHMNPERFPGGFIGDHVERFQAAQRPHLANWWQSNITSERFPNWEQCVATDESGQVQWDSRGDSALLYPQFLDNPGSPNTNEEGDPPEDPETEEVAESEEDSEPDDLQMDCDSLRAFFANNPQAIDLTNQVAADSEQALLNAETLQPWHGFLDRLTIIDPDPRMLDHVPEEEVTRMEVARAHNRLASRFTDFQDHVAGWDEDELGQLLAFDQVRNSPATQQNCPGMEAPSGFQWSDLLLAIPGAGVVAASFDMRDNYTAFVVGANGQQTYWQNQGDASTDLAIGMAAAVPLAAAEMAAGRYVIGPGMELAEPYVRPAIDRAGEVLESAKGLSQGAIDRVRTVTDKFRGPGSAGQLDDVARVAPGTPFPVRPPTAPRTNALAEFTERTGREVEVGVTLTPQGPFEAIIDSSTGDPLFFWLRRIDEYQGQPSFGRIEANVRLAPGATIQRPETLVSDPSVQGNGFYSFMFNRMVRQAPDVRHSTISGLTMDNVRILRENVELGYDPIEAFKATPAYRVRLQNGFTEIIEESVEIIRNRDGSFSTIELVMRKPD